MCQSSATFSYEQEIDLLAPLKHFPAYQALNQEDCQELDMFPKMTIVNSLLLAMDW